MFLAERQLDFVSFVGNLQTVAKSAHTPYTDGFPLTSVRTASTLPRVMLTIIALNCLMAGRGLASAVTPRDRRSVWCAYVQQTSTGQQEETI